LNKTIEKYESFFTVLRFVLIGLFTAILLSIIKYFIDDTPVLEILEGPLFISVMAIIVGISYCEVKFYIKNIILASIVFGVISSQLFLLFLVSFFYFYDDTVRDIPLDWYLVFIGIGSGSLILMYIKIESKKYK